MEEWPTRVSIKVTGPEADSTRGGKKTNNPTQTATEEQTEKQFRKLSLLVRPDKARDARAKCSRA